MEGNTDQIRQCNSNEPHGQDADRHRKLGIAGRTHRVRKGKGQRPDHHTADAVVSDHDHCHPVSTVGKVIRSGEQWCCCQKQDIQNPKECVGSCDQLLCIASRLLIISCSDTLTNHGCHGKSHRRSRHESKLFHGHCTGICCNRCCSKSGNHALGQQLSDLEHTVFQRLRNTDGKDLFQHLLIPSDQEPLCTVDLVFFLMQQYKNHNTGKCSGNQSGKCHACNSHAKAENKNGISDDVQRVHHNGGNH